MQELQHIADPALASTDSMSANGFLGAKESYAARVGISLGSLSFAFGWWHGDCSVDL